MDAYINATVASLLEGTPYPPISMRSDTAIPAHQRTVWGAIKTLSRFPACADPITEPTLKLAHFLRDHFTVTVPYLTFLGHATELASCTTPFERSFIDAAICVYAYYTEHVRSTHPCHPKSRARITEDGRCTAFIRSSAALRNDISSFASTVLRIPARDLFGITPVDPFATHLRAAVSAVTSFVDHVDTLPRVHVPVAVAYNTVTLYIGINLQIWASFTVTLQNMHISSLALIANAITAAPFDSILYLDLVRAETAVRASMFLISSPSIHSSSPTPVLAPSYLRPIKLPHSSPSMPESIPL